MQFYISMKDIGWAVADAISLPFFFPFLFLLKGQWSCAESDSLVGCHFLSRRLRSWSWLKLFFFIEFRALGRLQRKKPSEVNFFVLVNSDRPNGVRDLRDITRERKGLGPLMGFYRVFTEFVASGALIGSAPWSPNLDLFDNNDNDNAKDLMSVLERNR